MANFFSTGGAGCLGEEGWEKFVVQEGAEPLGGLENLWGAETPLDSMRSTRSPTRKIFGDKY